MSKVFRILILIRYLLRKFKRTSQGNSLIILKIDAIGDYLVFRNCLQLLRESDKYKGYHISLLGNVMWKDLALEFDQNYVDQFIWINPAGLNEVKERAKIFDEVSKKNYKDLITFHYSRSLATEVLSLVIRARHKITMDGDHLNLKPSIKKLTDYVYSTLITVPTTIVHEFKKNSSFLSGLLGEVVTLERPFINPGKIGKGKLSIEGSYLLVAPGAGVINRQVSKNTLLQMVAYLLSKKIKLCFVGSRSEMGYVEELLHVFETELIINLTGKTSLPDLAYLAYKSGAVICNDSSLFHLAISLNKKTLCFAGGGHFERFVHYASTDNVYLCYHNMPCFNCDWNCIFHPQADQRYPCIEKIELSEVLGILDGKILCDLKVS